MGILLGDSTATAVCESPVSYCSACMLNVLLLNTCSVSSQDFRIVFIKNKKNPEKTWNATTWKAEDLVNTAIVNLLAKH